MKFVIWGAGVRGKRVFSFLGKTRVMAFIDNNQDKQDQVYNECPIISLEKYKREYNECFIIITPICGSECIEQELQYEGIYKFFNLKDCPDFFYEYEYYYLMENIIKEIKLKDKLVFYGCNLLGILVYEYLNQRYKKNMYIIESEDKYRCNVDVLKKSFCNLHFIKLNQVQKNDFKEVYSLARNIEEKQFKVCYLYNHKNLKKIFYNSQLEYFKGIHKGKRCFIVATGPSLKISDLDILHVLGEQCISMNGIYHAFVKTKWRPDYYVMSDPNIIFYENIICNMDVKYKLISDNTVEFWKKNRMENILRLHMLFNERELAFSDNIAEKVYSAFTVTYVCLQLAVFLGFEKIYLIGVDFNNVINKKARNSHFVSDYNAVEPLKDGKLSGEDIYKDDDALALMEKGYKAAYKYAMEHDINIYNATRGGNLEVFERVDFDEIFREK